MVPQKHLHAPFWLSIKFRRVGGRWRAGHGVYGSKASSKCSNRPYYQIYIDVAKCQIRISSEAGYFDQLNALNSRESRVALIQGGTWIYQFAPQFQIMDRESDLKRLL